MMMGNLHIFLRWGPWLLGLSLLGGCAEEISISPNEEAAGYFGLKDAERCFERSDGSTENWEIVEYAQGEDYWQYRITSKSNGFVIQERSFSFQVSDSGLFIESWHECSNSCQKPEQPIQVLGYPVFARDRFEIEVALTETMGSESAQIDETHTFFVGDEKEVDTLTGTQNGFEVQWTRTRLDDVFSNTLVFVPEMGFVSWTDDTGMQLTQLECSE